MRFFIVSAFIISLSASISQGQDNPDQAVKLLQENKIDEAIDLLKPFIHSTSLADRARAQQLLGQAYLRNRNFDDATSSTNEALQIARWMNDEKREAECLYAFARLDALKGDFESAKTRASVGAALAKRLGYTRLEFQIRGTLSQSHFETNTDFHVILENEARVATLAQELKDELAIAYIYNNLGYDLTISGHVPLDSTIHLMEVANKIYSEKQNNKGRWYTLMNLTWQHRLKNELTKSLEYGLLSVAQAKADNDRHAIIETCFQTGETLMAMNRLKEAESYYTTALQHAGETKDRDKYVLDVYYGRYLWQTGKKEEATKRMEDAVAFLTTSEVFYEMHGRALLAQYYLELGMLEKADSHLKPIENPRHNYISFETKFMAASTRSKLYASRSQKEISNDLLMPWIEQAKEIQAEILFK